MSRLGIHCIETQYLVYIYLPAENRAMTSVKMDQFNNPLARDTNGTMQPVAQNYGYDAMNQQTVQITQAPTPVYTEQFRWCDFVMSFIT